MTTGERDEGANGTADRSVAADGPDAEAPFEPMTDAEAAFAARLAEDLERVLGEGIAIADLELHGEGPVRIRAACLVDGSVREIEGTGETSLEAYQELVRQAAELRLAAAWWRIVGPA
jgi:hypothetical protein